MTRKMKKNVQNRQKKPTPFADAGRIAGQQVGKMFNMPYLKGVGKWLGSGIGQIFGSGDYQMMGPSPKYNVLASDRQIPQFSTSERTNIVCNREYIGDIGGSVGFLNRSYPLNPGLSTTFPWLSSVAKCYQQYRIHGLIFEFRPLLTDFVLNGAPGVIVMATNYNADRPPFTTKVQMENAEYAVSVKPTMNMIHGIECAESDTPQTRLYVRTGAVPGGQDLRSYDLGLTQIATQLNPTQLLGELWVSYCVELFKPLLPEDIGVDAKTSVISRISHSSASPLGTVQVTTAGDIPGIIVNSTTISMDISVPNGNYLLAIIWKGDTNGVIFIPSLATSSGVTSVPTVFGNSTSLVTTQPGTSTLSCFLNYYFKLVSSDSVQTITLNGGGILPTVNTACTITLTKVDDIYE